MFERLRLGRQVKCLHRQKFGRSPVPPEIGQSVHRLADLYFGHSRGE
jgi:hypothetical protein